MAQENPKRFRMARDSDAVGFLDLAGLPRGRREHTIFQDGEWLVARYETPDGAVDFVLSGPEVPVLPVALDAGERVLLADFCARRAGGSAAIGWLTQAVNELDYVIDSIPAGVDRVPDEDFTNARGMEARNREKGRFSRERLSAYRDSLRTQLDELQPPPAKEGALINAQAIAEGVRPLLNALARDRAGEILKSLRPRIDDYAQVFLPDLISAAQEHFEGMWNRGIDFDLPSNLQTEIRIAVAPAGMLRHANEMSFAFPGGYRGIAERLQPHRVWVAWKYTKPGETSGLAYDGLVWVEDHWIWFPKPYRVAAPQKVNYSIVAGSLDHR